MAFARKGRRWGWRVRSCWLVIGGFSAPALLALAVFMTTVELRSSRMRARIRARGEVLKVRELSFAPPAAGVDIEAWLAEAEGFEASWWLYDPTDLELVLVTLSEPGLDAETRAILERLREGLQRGDSLETLDDPLSGALSETARNVLMMRGLAYEPSAEWIADACRLSEFDVPALVAEYLASDSPFLDLGDRIRLIFGAMRALHARATLNLLIGEFEQALSAIEAVGCFARRMESLPGVESFQVRLLVRSYQLTLLRRALVDLPGGIDLSAIESSIVAYAPLEDLRRSLLQDRAFGLRIHDEFSGGLTEKLGQRGWAVQIFGRFGQLEYLEEYERILVDLDKPYWELESYTPEVPFYGVIALMILPQIDQLRESAAGLVAERALAAVALTAYREGGPAAEQLARLSPDPFDGSALRTKISDGWFLCWSIGRDGSDDGGRALPLEELEFTPGRGAFDTDLVWHVPLDR